MNGTDGSIVLRRWLLGCGGVVLLMVAGLGLGGWYVQHLWRSAPEGWQRVEAMRQETTAESRRVLAAEVEKRVGALLSSFAGPGAAQPAAGAANAGPSADSTGSRIVTLSNEEINAWLEHRLPLWAANRGTPLPTEISDIRYWPEDGRAALAAQVMLDDVTQVVSVTFKLVLDGSDSARLEMGEIRGGQLPMPGEELIEEGIAELKSRDSSDAAEMAAQVLSGAEFEPILAIDHERQVRLTEFSVDAEGMTLTFQNEPIVRR